MKIMINMNEHLIKIMKNSEIELIHGLIEISSNELGRMISLQNEPLKYLIHLI
jgi:hypothetical protein